MGARNCGFCHDMSFFEADFRMKISHGMRNPSHGSRNPWGGFYETPHETVGQSPRTGQKFAEKRTTAVVRFNPLPYSAQGFGRHPQVRAPVRSEYGAACYVTGNSYGISLLMADSCAPAVMEWFDPFGAAVDGVCLVRRFALLTCGYRVVRPLRGRLS